MYEIENTMPADSPKLRNKGAELKSGEYPSRPTKMNIQSNPPRPESKVNESMVIFRFACSR